MRHSIPNGALAALCLFACVALAGCDEKFHGTIDVIYGLDNPSASDWKSWRGALERYRERAKREAKFEDAIYRDPLTAWAARPARQLMLFMFDESFYRDGRYRTPELLASWRSLYGPINSVLLWHAYPRLGFDHRDQFDFYRDMPGGVARLRRDVVDPLHLAGIRVFLNFNPWDEGASYERLAELVAELDADGVMLDTMTDVPEALKRAVDARKKGVVFAPERRPTDHELGFARQSWAQWYDLGVADRPSIYRQKWLVPAHQQLAIRRWDHSRHGDIAYSFFNGSGFLIWDNIYGSWNPLEPADRRLLAETGVVLEAYGELLATAEWLPLVPTGVSGLDANRWQGKDGTRLTIYRNRTDKLLELPPQAQRSGSVSLLAPGPGRVAAHGVQAIVDDPSRARAQETARLAAAAREAAARARPEYDARTPDPRALTPDFGVPAPGFDPTMMVALPGGELRSRVSHKKRECGCVDEGAGAYAKWGWYFEDVITHEAKASLGRFAMRRTAVTNAEYLAFVHESGYVPLEAENFLKHLPRGAEGALPAQLDASVGELPVTYVSLADARAYARHKRQRLPTEAEWQWAAEGAGAGNRWPWGGDETRAADPLTVNRTGALASVSSHIHGATPQGISGLTANSWELTESERSDGHTRFVLLRGGSFLAPARSEWVIPRGPRPNDFHAKYLLMGDGLDRSASVSFRTVADLNPAN